MILELIYIIYHLLQEAAMHCLVEDEQANPTEQAHLSKLKVVKDQLLRPKEPASDNAYRLVGVISHYGSAAHSGHYMSDVYSVERDRWYRYDDRRVSCADEISMLGDDHERNGYVFMYMHNDAYMQYA